MHGGSNFFILNKTSDCLQAVMTKVKLENTMPNNPAILKIQNAKHLLDAGHSLLGSVFN
jgi:hypothetical protein